MSTNKSELTTLENEVSNTPQQMLKVALFKGASIEIVEKLMALQERWEASEAKKAYHSAMSDFKANPPKIKKDKKVGYDSKNGGGRVGYSHASLGNVTELINAGLSKHGLSAGWTVVQNEDEIAVTTKITHKLGHSETTTLKSKADATGSKNPIQAVGSAITYLERYGLLALTGLATYDMDDDGKTSQAVELISDKEHNQLLDIIADRGVNLIKFLEFLKIEDLKELPKSQFKNAMASAELKKKPVTK